MARFPTGTPYIGPTMCYDDQIEPDQLLRRLAYGRAAPMLGHRARMDGRFFGKLLDNLSNAHVVLIKTTRAESTARHVAAGLRKELPAKLFDVAVDHDPDADEWNVLAFNRIPVEQRRVPVRLAEGGPAWVTLAEVARVLRITPSQASRVVSNSSIPVKRRGGRNEILVRQKDLLLLANRPGRWKRRRRRAA